MISIRHRRGTSTQWTTINPILAEGEIGFETNTGKFKFGNGTSSWTSLGYVLPELLADAKYALKTSLALKADLVNGVIPTSQIPAIAINETFIVASQSAMLALTAQRGDVAVRTEVAPERWYMLTTDVPSVLANWRLMTTAGSGSGNIVSVNGDVGPAVVLDKTDIGLGNVANLSPTNLGISAATQAALDSLTAQVDALKGGNTGTPSVKSWVSPVRVKPTTGFLRTINVSTKAQLDAALADLRYGDNIILAAATYTYTANLVIQTPARGTFSASAPPPPTWISGPRTAIISRTGTSSGYAVHMDKANFLVMDGFTIKGGEKALIADETNDCVLQNLDVGQCGMELLHLRNFSNRNIVVKCYVHHSDIDGGDGGSGEGLYVGQSESNWNASFSRTGGAVDVCNDNWFYENNVEACFSECLDIKEGTTRTVVRGNTFQGSRISGLNSADSYLDVKGNNSIVEDNVGLNPSANVLNGFETHILYAGWGNRNLFRRNKVTVNNPLGYGYMIQESGSRGDAVGNIVYSDNSHIGAGKGLSNISVTA